MPPDAVPRWTDHNVHDPGVTLLRVLAFGLATTLGAAAVRTWWSHRQNRRDGT